MKIHPAGTVVESTERHQGSAPNAIHPAPWPSILRVLTGDRPLRAVQRIAVDDAQILESRKNLVVCAPTNSGKTVVGYLLLMEALLKNRNALLIEPLRALAQEKADELKGLLSQLSPDPFSTKPEVRLTTGDYRLESETPDSPPPKSGRLIVATPERFEAILRNPSNEPWISGIGAVVVDEAHLIKDTRRGPTLELVLASLLSLAAPPRVALLSATVGNPDRLKEWMEPCHLITSSVRTPLAKEVWELGPDESAEEVLTTTVKKILEDPEASVLIFVYRKSSAEALARQLSAELQSEVLSYHSDHPIAEKTRRREAFQSGQCRCVVSTTALAMGVNLPATHVVVRDTTFYGVGKLPVDQLLQILGRAGRGDRAGTGIVLVRSDDDWNAGELARALAEEKIEPIRSSFEPAPSPSGRFRSVDGSNTALPVATVVAGCLSRLASEGVSPEALRRTLANTLAGKSLADRVDEAIRWLAGPDRHLAYLDENGLAHLTVLGRAGIQSMLPLPIVAGVGQLVRDLLSLDPQGGLLQRWSGLDHLLVIALLSERTPKLRRFSESMASQIDGWHEARAHAEKSLLFSEWLAGTSSVSKASELFGSLGITTTATKRKSSGSARTTGYVAMLSAIVLHERANGASVSDLEERWSISGLAGLEENWRDTALWLISGLTAIFEIRAFYHHLREHCDASADRIKHLKRVLLSIRHHGYELMDQVKYCTPLGGLLRGLQNLYAGHDGQTAGLGTIRRLEMAGIGSIRQLASMSVNELMALGVQRRYAVQIRRYVERRLK